MSGNFYKPPTAGEGPVNLPLIFEATGLPLENCNAEFVRSHIIPCVAATFSDGELVIQRPLEKDPVMQEHFGATNYDEGSFGQRLRELFDGDDPTMRHQVDGLIRSSAEVFASDVVNNKVVLPPQQNVKIHTQPEPSAEELLGRAVFGPRFSSLAGETTKPAIEFDHQKVELAHQPKVVVDYGPGLQGRFHIEHQLADAKTGSRPYTHFAMGKGPFINMFLQHYWANRLNNNPQLIRDVIGNIYIGREDGIAAASTELATAQQQYAGSPECADLVLASGIHTAGHKEVGTGIANAYKLLKSDGTLLIRAPKNANGLETPGSVSAETMVDMALSAGFDQAKAQFFDTRTGGDIGPQVDSLSAVFRK